MVCLLEEQLTADAVGRAGEICLLGNTHESAADADNRVMALLEQVAMACATEAHEGGKLLCHVLLQSQSLMQMIREEGFRSEIEERLEVCPFTLEDQWSLHVVQTLDRGGVTVRSERSVHLVIFGLTAMAEQLAVNAAHVCHYPNFVKNRKLKTRITIIDDDAIARCQTLIQRYQHLFDNSYWRLVDTERQPAVVKTSRPMYVDRGDFVDIEWEFVKGKAYDDLVRTKLRQWSQSAEQLLTVVFAHDDGERSLNEALHLPMMRAQMEMTDCMMRNADIPVWVYMKSDAAFRQIAHGAGTPHLLPFGMTDRGYDVGIPYVRMAKTVNYIYSHCRAVETDRGEWTMEYAVEVDHEEREQLWSRLAFNKRMSSIYNAMGIGVKMRALGLREDDWEKFYDISQEEIELLSMVEHNRWCVDQLLLGYRPCSDEEQRAVEADISMKDVLKRHKIHYDLRTYVDLRPDASGKHVQIYDHCLCACIPLIAKESVK